MSKQLIVEYIPFKPVGALTEQSGAAYGIPGGVVVQGVLQRAGAKNQNGCLHSVLKPLHNLPNTPPKKALLVTRALQKRGFPFSKEHSR